MQRVWECRILYVLPDANIDTDRFSDQTLPVETDAADVCSDRHDVAHGVLVYDSVLDVIDL